MSPGGAVQERFVQAYKAALADHLRAVDSVAHQVVAGLSETCMPLLFCTEVRHLYFAVCGPHALNHLLAACTWLFANSQLGLPP
jgi:hypothetical protein